ncbi:hypothetical protein NFI96_009222 [Prochilodus magdalenae]|nr:hypothetical protein NFI96_009222 [Prochilodus magdalenae]
MEGFLGAHHQREWSGTVDPEKRIHSDQGANFESDLIAELLKLSGVAKSHTTAYHPMGNGCTERFNRTLGNMLRSLPLKAKHQWPQQIQTLTFAYNATVHETSGFAPFQLMFGRVPRLPVDVMFQHALRDSVVVGYDAYVETLMSYLQEASKIAQQHATKEQRKQAQGYNRRVKGIHLNVGDRVLVANKGERGKKKLADRWEATVYTIVDRNPQTHTYKLQGENGATKVVHRNLLLDVSYLPVGFDSEESISTGPLFGQCLSSWFSTELQDLSPAQCSIIAYMLLHSEKVRKELNLKKFNTSEEGYKRLIPAITNSRKAHIRIRIRFIGQGPVVPAIWEELGYVVSRFRSCTVAAPNQTVMDVHRTDLKCITVSAVPVAEEKENSSLKELDLSKNDVQDLGMKQLSTGLKSSNCKLERLRLVACNLTEKSCGFLTPVFFTPLRELDLTHNGLQDSGVKLLTDGLKSSHCKLEILRLALCNLGETSCEILGSALKLENSSLKELDLSMNDLQDSGIEKLSDGLKSSHCKLEILRLSGCLVTEDGCSSLTSALKSNPTKLKELDLSYNHPGECGLKLLSDPYFKHLILRGKKVIPLQDGPYHQVRQPLTLSTTDVCHTLRRRECSQGRKPTLDELADDTTVIGLIRGDNETAYRDEVQHLAAWCDDNNLVLNTRNNQRGSLWTLERSRNTGTHSNPTSAELRVENEGKRWIKPSLRKYAWDLTLDSNTVYSYLSLSEENRKVERVDEDQDYPDHPDRFDSRGQVLCVEGLTGRCYWEAEWSGEATAIAGPTLVVLLEIRTHSCSVIC